jgi:hypothetical protein
MLIVSMVAVFKKMFWPMEYAKKISTFSFFEMIKIFEKLLLFSWQSHVKIAVVDQTKYLGIIIDNRLHFQAHAPYTHKKISIKAHFLKRMSTNLSLQDVFEVEAFLVTRGMYYTVFLRILS